MEELKARVCMFAQIFEDAKDCVYAEDGICDEIDINPENSDSWCGGMIEKGIVIRAKTEWISVEDKIPSGDCLVLLERESIGLKMHTASYHEKITIIGSHFEYDMPKVTHWMPLPKPPKEDN